MSDATTGKKAVRDEVRQRRLVDRVQRARDLKGIPPAETMDAAFDLTTFTRELSRVGT